MPKSTTMHGPPNRWCAAIVLTMRSAPTSFGLSVSTGTPVLVPGSTMTVGTPAKYRSSITRISRSTAGTVLHRAIPPISPASARSPR